MLSTTPVEAGICCRCIWCWCCWVAGADHLTPTREGIRTQVGTRNESSLGGTPMRDYQVSCTTTSVIQQSYAMPHMVYTCFGGRQGWDRHRNIFVPLAHYMPLTVQICKGLAGRGGSSWPTAYLTYQRIRMHGLKRAHCTHQQGVKMMP
jgi:hypothetical protein